MTSTLSLAFKSARKEFNGRFIVPYQSEGIGWMLSRELSNGTVKGGFLCDEMGLGKTAQTIATILGNRVQRTIIIAPKSIITQWVSEFNRFAPQLNIGVYDGQHRTELIIDDYDVIIAPYSVIYNRKKDCNPWNTFLHKYAWDRVILDEGHEIRNRRSKTHRAATALRAKYRWVLSGTPIYNSMLDFVALCNFIHIPKAVVQANPEKIKNLYILRRTKDDVARHNERLALPKCHFENVELEMNPEEAELYEIAFTRGHDMINDIFKNANNIAMHNMSILECLLRVRQAMIHPQLYLDGMAAKKEEEERLFCGTSKKFETLLSMIKEHPLEKSLIFCQFHTEMDLIQDMLNAHSIKTFRIDGSVAKDERDARINDFKNYHTGAAFIIQVKAGGVGLNLQEATRVYITAPSWNPATELQAIGRSHRTGQTQRVYVKKLIYQGTEDTPSIEQSIMNLQGHKAVICAEVLNDKRLENVIPVTNRKGVTIRDVRDLFKTTNHHKEEDVGGHRQAGGAFLAKSGKQQPQQPPNIL